MSEPEAMDLPGRCRLRRAVATGTEAAALSQRTHVPLQDALLSLFGLLFGAHGARRTVAVTTRCDGWFDRTATRSVSFLEEWSLSDLALAWNVDEIVPGSKESPRRFLEALTFPAVSFGSSLGTAGPLRLEHAFPLLATFEIDADTIDLVLSAETSPSELSGLALQLEVLIRRTLEQPRLSLGGLLAGLPPTRLDLLIAGATHVHHVVPAIRSLSEDIGLSTRITTIPLGGALPSARPRFPRLPGVSVSVALISEPDWTEHGASVTHPKDAHAIQYTLDQLIESETRELLAEVFLRRRYLRHGLEIDIGATVVDVGANIGVFTLFAHQCAADVTVHAVEPAAQAYSALCANISRHHIQGHAFNVALGSSPGDADFTYYPKATLQSGLHPDVARDRDVTRHFARQRVQLSPGATLKPPIADATLRLLVDPRYACEHSRVAVRTLSDLIDELNLDRIDFLKVDVERSEDAVLAGIRSDHWHKIQQVAIEVHDIQGRVKAIQALLSAHGFAVVVEQDELFTGTEVFMVYARRPRTAVRGPIDHLVGAIKMLERHASGKTLSIIVPSEPPVPPESIRLLEASTTAPVLNILPPTRGQPIAQSPPWVPGVASEVLKVATELFRAPPKAIAVDADGTLWSGVCGEDGPTGLALTEGHLALQRFLVMQRDRGVLLFLVTKNDYADVENAFTAHPEMPLRIADFASVRATWAPKSQSISRLSSDHSMRLESIVFIDDSPQERLEIALQLPDVIVIDLPQEASAFARAAQECWVFGSRAVTLEDRQRSRYYSEDVRRRSVALSSLSFRGYLEALGILVGTSDAGENDTDRIHQLSSRTNQFNFSMARLSRASVSTLLQTSWRCFKVEVRDNYGDYGMVGFVALDRNANGACVKHFWLSCRALGRNVEWAILRDIGQLLREHRVDRLELRVHSSDRNEIAQAFVRAVAEHCAGTLDDTRLAVVVDVGSAAQIDWLAVDPFGRERDVTEEPLPSRSGEPRVAYCWPGMLQARRGAVTPRPRPDLGTPLEGPVGAVELEISEIYARCGFPSLGRHDSLLAAGADSIRALLVCAAVSEAFQCEVNLENYLAAPTIAHLAAAVASTPTGPSRRSLQTTSVREPVRATHGQRRIWSAEVTGHSNAQIIPLVFRIRGPLSVETLEHAMMSTFCRHEALTTCLFSSESGLLHCKGRGEFMLESSCSGLSEVDSQLREFMARSFDLKSGPMVRALLLAESAEAHVLAIVLHHSAADGWSVRLLLDEISDRYNQVPRSSERDASFAEYAYAIDTECRLGQFTESATYLLRALSRMGGPVRMRTDRPRARGASLPAFRRMSLPRQNVEFLEECARSLGTTSATVALSLLQLLLACRSDRSSTTVGYLVANRANAHLFETVGFLANIIPMCSVIDWAVDLVTHVAASCRSTFDSLRHAGVPYGQFLSALHGDDYVFFPPFEALLTVQNQPAAGLRLADCQVAALEPPTWPLPFEFMIDIDIAAQSPTTLFRWDANLYSEATIEWFYEGLILLTAAVRRAPRVPLLKLKRLLAPDSQAVHDAPAEKLRSGS